MSIAVVALFLGITFWWLTQDRSIPIFDAGVRLSQAIIVYEHLRSGSVGTALTTTTPYPPFSYLVGALGLWIGGLGVAPPIIAQNLVFVPALALGCYNVGRLAFGSRAGLLAVVFVLGSPLITAQFHVFMIDAPETAMVAVAVWLILASERFSRVWISAAAGVAVGLGMVTKEPFTFFVAGVVLVTLARGGWRAWRGLAAFSIVALTIAMPWYVSEFSQVHALAQGVTNANQSATLGPNIAPPRWSITNLMWYLSNILNQQLYAPLFGFAMVGGAWTITGLARRRPISPLSWELVIGAFVGWLGITDTFPHDTRYSMPLLIYLAVFGSGWIVRLARTWRVVATSALVLIATANTLSTSFGLGTVVNAKLPEATSNLLKTPSSVTIYSNAGFLVSGPHRDGDVLALMRALRRNGVQQVTWISLGPKEPPPGLTPEFSEGGLTAFTLIAKLNTPSEEVVVSRNLTHHDAILGHGPVTAGVAPPCATLSDGTGVWVRLGDPNAPGAKDYCPYRHPAFY
jgi:4-amino-4-deoxy-L-arabinose transferase-like glycosyltransferase